MSLLFKTNKNHSIVLNEQCAKLVPALKELTENELLLVILTTDYMSPYWQWPEDERIRKSLIHVYGNSDRDATKTDRIKKARASYTSLQYDHRRELLNVHLRKLDLLQNEYSLENDKKQIKILIDSIILVKSQIVILQKEISNDNDFDNSIEGGGKISLIEIMQKNMKSFKELNKPKEVWDPK